MPIEINIGQEGLEAFQEALELMKKLGARVYGAELMDTPRLDGTARNTEIIKWLSESGRDMFSLGDDEGKCLQHIADEIINSVDSVMKRRGEVTQGRTKAIMGKALQKGLRWHIDKNVLPRIETNTNADGSTAAAVTELYSGYRAIKFGIPDDPTQVGVASGQLIEALSRGIIRAKAA